jgi:hypothetical protein
VWVKFKMKHALSRAVKWVELGQPIQSVFAWRDWLHKWANSALPFITRQHINEIIQTLGYMGQWARPTRTNSFHFPLFCLSTFLYTILMYLFFTVINLLWYFFFVTRLIKAKRETKQRKKDKEKLITAEKGFNHVKLMLHRCNIWVMLYRSITL